MELDAFLGLREGFRDSEIFWELSVLTVLTLLDVKARRVFGRIDFGNDSTSHRKLLLLSGAVLGGFRLAIAIPG